MTSDQRVRSAGETMIAFGGFGLVAVAPFGMLQYQLLSPPAQTYYVVLTAGAAALVALGVWVRLRPAPRVVLLGAVCVGAVLLVNQIAGVAGNRILCFGPT